MRDNGHNAVERRIQYLTDQMGLMIRRDQWYLDHPDTPMPKGFVVKYKTRMRELRAKLAELVRADLPPIKLVAEPWQEPTETKAILR